MSTESMIVADLIRKCNDLTKELEAAKKHCKWADDEIEQLNAGIHKTSIKYCERIAERDALQAKLIECRPSVKFHNNDYARFMLRKRPPVNTPDVEEEKRLGDLLDYLDELAGAAHKESNDE